MISESEKELRVARAMYQNGILIRDGESVPYIRFDDMSEPSKRLALSMARAALAEVVKIGNELMRELDLL